MEKTIDELIRDAKRKTYVNDKISSDISEVRESYQNDMNNISCCEDMKKMNEMLLQSENINLSDGLPAYVEDMLMEIPDVKSLDEINEEYQVSMLDIYDFAYNHYNDLDDKSKSLLGSEFESYKKEKDNYKKRENSVVNAYSYGSEIDKYIYNETDEKDDWSYDDYDLPF